MNSSTNDSICALMAENGGMKMLLSEMLAELETNIKHNKRDYFGCIPKDAECFKKNDDLARRMREFLRDFEA